jgi:hypothetical protein
MNLSKIRKQIIKSIFDFEYKREAGIAKYLKIILTNGNTYNCIDVELFSNNIEIELDEKIQINYIDIANVVIL